VEARQIDAVIVSARRRTRLSARSSPRPLVRTVPQAWRPAPLTGLTACATSAWRPAPPTGRIPAPPTAW